MRQEQSTDPSGLSSPALKGGASRAHSVTPGRPRDHRVERKLDARSPRPGPDSPDRAVVPPGESQLDPGPTVRGPRLDPPGRSDDPPGAFQIDLGPNAPRLAGEG